MAGNARFELKSASPDSGFAGGYISGQRGAYNGPISDRSGSFSESAGSRVFGYGKGSTRASTMLMGEIPPVSHCLTLEPVIMGEPKFSHVAELRRVMGLVASTSEDNSYSSAHLKPSPLSMDELRRYMVNVADKCNKASGRTKTLEGLLLHNANIYNEVTKKQQRNDLLVNERSGVPSLKTAIQIHRGPSELAQKQKPDDRPKNGTLIKRTRTSVAETRSEYRTNGLQRQPALITKERDMHKDSNADCDMTEEKVRKFPAGGEGWDKKIKRKRSFGSVNSRPIEDDGEVKRTMHHKLPSEASFPSCDSHGFKSGLSGAAGGNSKSEGTSPASSSGRALQSEQEKSPLSRDLTAGLNKEKLFPKGHIKFNSCDEINGGPSPITKGKASRAPRSGSMVPNNSGSTVPRVLGTHESWDQAPNGIKNLSVGGANNRKRPFPSGSSSPPITQWIGQRPQKISRTRRVNLVSPVSNNDEIQMSSDGCSPSDFGARLTTSAVNHSLLPKGTVNESHNGKVKTECVLSPTRLSDSEESGAGENKLEDKGIGYSEGEEKAAPAVQTLGPSASHMKNKFLDKDEIGDGVRRQGRSGRVSSFTRGNISPTMEKPDNLSTTKPLRPTKPIEKNGSKSGRPLKKQSERKGFSRLGHPTSSESPDFTGDSDDGREELLSAANSAHNSSVQACSSAFWKRVEAFFASISSEEKLYLSDQLKASEELHTKLTKISCSQNGVLSGHVADPVSVDRKRCLKNQSGSKSADLVDKPQNSIPSENLNSSKNINKVTPLYQRVLSALIMEDDLEELEENKVERSSSLQGLGDSPDEASPFVDFVGNRNMDRTEFARGSVVGVVQLEKNGISNKFASCNGYGTYTGIQDSPDGIEVPLGENGFMHSEIGLLVDLSRCNNLEGLQSRVTSSFSISSSDHQYAQMTLNDRLLMELQSVGIYVETVPGLEDKEDEAINQEIVQLERGLYQQISRKKAYLGKISHAIQEGKDIDCRDPEQVAMNKLVELAYKKLLATRKAPKMGLPKVSKQVALAFARRTLARCRKFEETGESCFSNPTYRDIIFASPPRFSEAELLAGCNISGSAGLIDPCNNNRQSDQAFARNGPLSNRGRKREILLDDIGSSSFRSTSTLGGTTTLFGGAKGKRSERDPSSARNAKTGRSSLGGNSKGDRKTRTKPKQKTGQLTTTSYNKFLETPNPFQSPVDTIKNDGNTKGESSAEVKNDSADPITNAPLINDIVDEIGDLGAGSQDLNAWFNFDVDGLQDQDCIGLEIPMDDLSELNMF
ncbi:hypothetical protein DM860_005529 [Cuscuta australis]|uniref:Uncharacterized protein n=1 Tax=Cuscuta australis TaxID=267555 RepID=A0A328E3W9_9ASTE|nr:hypothetical protein DM860_005529 [Cuscuta australis]